MLVSYISLKKSIKKGTFALKYNTSKMNLLYSRVKPQEKETKMLVMFFFLFFRLFLSMASFWVSFFSIEKR